ncbi:TIGR03936 family radical SAM-associated protein [Luteipulveratus sp. YIM 133132]|uniref:TIGR03936 family radical SAM-associated protein n=1 Tax=Luteipulveratus flavus TaxID=3031728 RepID=UPI0023AFA5E7|nr:TIGR03936 family radical SAM-associated protein [Luteipulveratus sp. YIM 133132]MDE9367617.1 TIGR03936 family radical SAM-associated protein [Luteipulveratus sp. YIM 133132]
MAKRVPEGPAPDPAVQKLRVQYAKRGRLRFSSTRDFQRALERALRRAQVPMAFSAGFHPHPRISYANAAPTGTASEAEYFEIQLRERREPAQVLDALDVALPDGLDILTVVEAQPGALADRLQASEWRLDFAAVAPTDLRAAEQAFLAESLVEVTRMMKSGPRTFDVRAAALATAVSELADGSRLEVTLRHTAPAVRPDDLLNGLRAVSGLEVPRSPLVTRLRQGVLQDDGSVSDPLETA